MPTTPEIPEYPLETHLLEVDSHPGVLQTAFALLDPESKKMFMHVFPTAAESFEPFQVPIVPPTLEEKRKALEDPQTYGVEAAKTLLKDLNPESASLPQTA
jgi:hypothetical protein